MMKLGILGSTNGTDLQAILEAEKTNKLKATINVVISNMENAYILQRAKNNGVPAIFINHKNKKRDDFDFEISMELKKHNIDLILLIGFMRILSAKFCQTWKDKILNVHPSLLPKYSGGMDMNIHEEVIANGDEESGCTIHFVTEELDGGPILIQKKYNITNGETAETLKTKIQELEGIAFVEAINKLSKK